MRTETDTQALVKRLKELAQGLRDAASFEAGQHGEGTSDQFEMEEDAQLIDSSADLIASLQKELAERTKERDEARTQAILECEAKVSAKYDAEKFIVRANAAEARADALAKKVEGLEAALQKARWYVEVYDTREHNTEQDDTLTEIDAALEQKP